MTGKKKKKQPKPPQNEEEEEEEKKCEDRYLSRQERREAKAIEKVSSKSGSMDSSKFFFFGTRY